MLLAAAIAFVMPSSALAQQEPALLSLSGLFGTGIVDKELGLTAGAGVALATARYVLRALFDVHVLQPADGDYEWEIGSVGPECRDGDSGLIVDDSRCSIERVLTGVSADASLIVPAFAGGIHLGAGYRLGSGSTAYGLVGYGFNPNDGNWQLLIRMSAGRELFGVQAIATVLVP